MVLKQIAQEVDTYVNQGYTFCPDSTFLMNAYEVFSKIENEPISISKEVFNELDRLKNAPQNATATDILWARQAREGFTVLDDAKAKLVDPAPPEVFAKYNLSNSEVEKIIANYLHYRDSENKKVIFLTFDEEAQAIAKAAGLECANFDIRKFHRKRERELNVYTADEIASGKKLNGFYRFNRRVYFLYRDIKRIGKMVVYTVLIIAVIIGVIAGLLG